MADSMKERENREFPPLQILRPPVIKISASDLPGYRLEIAPEFGLPESFRDFALQYGLGLLGGLFVIYMPVPGKFSLEERSAVMKHTMLDGFKRGLWEFEPDGSPELVRRLIPFARSEDGLILTWDPLDQTGPEEYRIYVIGQKLLAVRKAAPNLYSFVWKCLDERVRSILGSGYTPLDATFKPYLRAE
jgi:hypothetical protein